jgi:hypothetical protein
MNSSNGSSGVSALCFLEDNYPYLCCRIGLWKFQGPENWKGKFCVTKLEQLSVVAEYALQPIDVQTTIEK